MGKIIIPNTYIQRIEKPLIFLAGPIRSAPNWQDEAIQFIFSHNQDLIIVSPRRGIREKIESYVVKGNENQFSRQRAWERHYLEIAACSGAILFWLPGEEKHDCNKVYGAMTRVEIGQWMTRYKFSNDGYVNFVVGSDGKFPEINTIAYDLSLDAPEKIICSSLEETCLEALRMIH